MQYLLTDYNQTIIGNMILKFDVAVLVGHVGSSTQWMLFIVHRLILCVCAYSVTEYPNGAYGHPSTV